MAFSKSFLYDHHFSFHGSNSCHISPVIHIIDVWEYYWSSILSWYILHALSQICNVLAMLYLSESIRHQFLQFAKQHQYSVIKSKRMSYRQTFQALHPKPCVHDETMKFGFQAMSFTNCLILLGDVIESW